ncbi:MAG: AbrB/MazE/SpoVT family DNA-binding domain-containing protein [Clostridiales bacterium]|nr:AbrB/MazE/SpoVT family DNA-binding domain-containing protein [Clostridiales bacterium]
MKSTVKIRQVDDLGRFVLPKKLRKAYNISPNDTLSIYTENDRIILQKYVPPCVFCSSTENITCFMEKRICGECLKKLKSML